MPSESALVNPQKPEIDLNGHHARDVAVILHAAKDDFVSIGKIRPFLQTSPADLDLLLDEMFKKKLIALETDGETQVCEYKTYLKLLGKTLKEDRPSVEAPALRDQIRVDDLIGKISDRPVLARPGEIDNWLPMRELIVAAKELCNAFPPELLRHPAIAHPFNRLDAALHGVLKSLPAKTEQHEPEPYDSLL